MSEIAEATAPPAEPQNIMREKILHTLRIFPKISLSMLQVGIGTSLAPVLWHPELDKLIEEGIVKRSTVQAQSPMNRQQVYTVLSLANVD